MVYPKKVKNMKQELLRFYKHGVRFKLNERILIHIVNVYSVYTQ